MEEKPTPSAGDDKAEKQLADGKENPPPIEKVQSPQKPVAAGQVLHKSYPEFQPTILSIVTARWHLWRVARRRTEKLRWTDRVMAYATLAMALATIAVGYTAYQQWKDSGQLTTAAQQAAMAASMFKDSAAATTTAVQLAQANIQTMADNAVASLKATQDALRLDQRAWITIQSLKMLAFTAGQPATAEIDVLNTGKTISGVGDQYGFIYLPTKYITDFSPPQVPIRKIVPILFPNSHNAIGVQTYAPITPTDVLEVQRGTRFLFIWGDITYKDIFKRPHHTNYCGVYDPTSSRFEVCMGYKYDAD